MLTRPEELEYEPLVAEALLRVGRAPLEAHRPERARASLTRGAVAAIHSGQDEVAAEALARRMWIVAEPLGRPEVGLSGASHLRWLFHNNHGAALFRHGDGAEAERAYLEALAEAEGDASPRPVEPERAGTIYAGLGGFASALVLHHGHRLVEALLASGLLADADARIVESISAQDDAGLPDDNVHRAIVLDLRGVLRLRQHEPEAAQRDHARACAVLATVHDEDDPVLAHCRLHWARALGSDPRAHELARRTHAACSALGPGFRAAQDEATALIVEPR